MSTGRWDPFRVEANTLVAPRSILQPDKQGIGDRLRTAAFAELQAEAAFEWAAERFTDAPEELREGWRHLAREERKHFGWLMTRMSELGIDVADRPVSDVLWQSLVGCASARDFALYMADAEERGRRAGERFCEKLRTVDPATAAIFGQIALEERGHIALAQRFYR